MMRSFSIGNRHYTVESVPESGYDPMNGERGSFLAKITAEVTFPNGYDIASHREYEKRLYFDMDGNVYRSKTIRQKWFNVNDKNNTMKS